MRTDATAATNAVRYRGTLPAKLVIDDVVRVDDDSVVTVRHLILTRGQWRRRRESADPSWVVIYFALWVIAYRVRV